MAEKKERKIISADTGEVIDPAAKAKEKASANAKAAKPVGNAGGLRAGAVALWVLAIVFEVLAVLVLVGKVNLTFMPVMYQLIAAIVLDLAFVIIGAQLWKKANRIDPASEKNKFKFWLWNNMGVVVCVFAFVPIIILMITNKNLDKKTKAICAVVAIIALLIGGLAGYEWDPVSEEQLDAAVEVLGDTDVFWAPFGKVYHTHEDCSSLNRSEMLTYGTVEQAVAANRTRLCSFCAKEDAIVGVVTDEAA